uniref:NTP_transf_2 domain-containing protein n=1 Tax=Angiostrongylus cantonensis TaxID=6313 RepID=A0A0K0DAS3_ANGCA
LRSALSTTEKVVVPIGSSVNGLGSKNSDLDIVVVVKQHRVRAMKFIKVPILKFRSCDGVNVDLQFNNIPSIRSSLFVRTCVEFSMIVPINIHWINSFFKAAQLKDSRHGLFSSYHLNMLALHFLQATPSPLLPDMISSYPYLQPTVPWQNVAERLTTEPFIQAVFRTKYSLYSSEIFTVSYLSVYYAVGHM